MKAIGMTLILAAIIIWLAFRRHKKNKAALPKAWLARHQASQEARKAELNKVARQKRIADASFWFQLLIGFFFVIEVYYILAFAFGWPFFSEYPAHMVVAPGHIYNALADMPGDVLAWVLVKTGLAFAAAAALFALFGLYRQGILFSARNVLYIQFQGYYLILNFIVDYLMQGALHDMSLSTTPIFVGFLIIFIAWIMDEGRKIQEEQALTV